MLNEINKLRKKIEQDPNRIPRDKYFSPIMYLKKMEDIKLVIVGQDPYSTAVKEFDNYNLYYDGIPFSSGNTIKTPGTLKTLQEWMKLADAQRGIKVGAVSNDLRYLLNRGVFFINVFWTVSYGKPKSHDFMEYYSLTGKVLQYIKHCYPKARYLLLGSEAHRMQGVLKGKQYLTDIHPAAVRYKDSEEYKGNLTNILKGLDIKMTI